ncbi:MAG TPA: shikimate dehydrogenase [Terriglobales bacterium]|nr:shikimate dehydrogenase [Terriglobales bacterium]
MTATATYVPRLLPPRLPRICVAITGSSGAEMVARAQAVVRDNPFIEFRLDYIRKPATGLPRIKAFLEYHPDVLAIATCRRAVNGGKFRGSVAAEIALLTRAAAHGCQLVDLELASAAKADPEDLSRLRSQAALILSHHDFKATRKLEQTFEKMRAIPADFYKLVTTAKCLADNVTMMKFLEQKAEKYSMVGVCMGEQGIISRVLGVRAGSVFTFAAASAGEETAPGQITGRTLLDVYRLNLVDAATRVYGVAGDPIEHSLSPHIMNAAFRRESVNAVYLALHARTLTDLLTCVRDIPIHGLSITMPYKEVILKHLDNTDAVTAKIGACNTVIRAQDGKLYGFNTDVAGVIRPLEQRLPIGGAKVLVLGAGGAARAAVFGLKERHAEVYVLNRTPTAGKRLAKQARARYLRRSELKKMQFDAIVNATPVGMGSGRQSPLKDNEVNARVVFEMVYVPAETRLVKQARARGAQVILGWEMLIHQAARQFEIWTGKPAPLDEIQRTMLRALEARAAAEKGKKKKKRK